MLLLQNTIIVAWLGPGMAGWLDGACHLTDVGSAATGAVAGAAPRIQRSSGAPDDDKGYVLARVEPPSRTPADESHVHLANCLLQRHP